ncbi:MAG: helix-turn-helix transcriptional regulator [Bacteroidales bacterium]|nr:helix-turn-helix transcriptional regulator [Bacteroidales bacterium]
MTFDEAPSATISRLREYQSATPSRWREYAEWRMNNSQQYVSKVLKGQENLSLETMSKIEACLGIQILPTSEM